jgi:probable HAF family extracellular repeat protein
VQLAGVEAWGASADGSVVVGKTVSSGKGWAFRWTQTTGVVNLGELPGGNYYANAYGVSSDGAVVVGYAASKALGAEVAFRWTSAEGMVALSNLDSAALAASTDGSIVVGYFGDMFTQEGAFVWDKQHGMRYLQDVLENECGLNLDGWTLERASGISSDGLTIVGWGWNADHNQEAFLATTPVAASAVSGKGQKWVTEWVSRHVVVACYRLLSDLSSTCNPRFCPENAM